MRALPEVATRGLISRNAPTKNRMERHGRFWRQIPHKVGARQLGRMPRIRQSQRHFGPCRPAYYVQDHRLQAADLPCFPAMAQEPQSEGSLRVNGRANVIVGAKAP